MAAATKHDDVQVVLLALKGSSNSAGSMIAAGLPHAAEPTPAQRHPFQTELLQLARNELRRAQKALEEEHAAVRVKVAEIRGDLEAFDARTEAAASDEASAADCVKAKENALAATRAEVKNAEQGHAAAESLKLKMDRRRAEQQKARDHVANVKDNALCTLCSGTCEDGATQKEAIQAVLELLKAIGAETTVLASAPVALKLKPDERGPIDKLIADGAEHLVTKHLEELDAELAADAREVAYTDAEALGLWAILDFAREASAEAEEALTSAKAALEEATSRRASLAKERVDQDKAVAAFLAKEVVLEQTCAKATCATQASERLFGEYDNQRREEASCAAEAMVVDRITEAPAATVA